MIEMLDGKRVARRLPVGAELLEGGTGVDFRVWAPDRRTVEVLAGDRAIPLQAEDAGYFSGIVPQLQAGATYRYRLDGGDSFPDPVSRFQPEGPHGPSMVVDPTSFHWSDEAWEGVELAGQILYEMHIGTFTAEGTWEGAIRQLPNLARTGVTVLEVMPVSEFTGSYGWGYDGVAWYAPYHGYGTPDDMRRFVDTAHRLGMGVILDVVYNHLGPDGNYTAQFSRDYVTEKYTTDWGDALNFDGPNSGPVRDFVTCNAGYWIREFNMDGLRLDATQNIYDDSENHILGVITESVRSAAGGRKTIVVAENEPQHVKMIRPAEKGGHGMDGLWNDDYHHSAVVALTGRSEAYYTDYRGTPQEFVSAMKYGYLYQGQWYKWQKKGRGTPAFDAPRSAFITFIENHDQVANSARGLRMRDLSAPALYRAMTALTLLGPGTPMLFQGQEFGSQAPFLFFADLPEALRDTVRKGRQEFVHQWRSIRTPAMTARLHDPCARETFEACKLDHSLREANAEVYTLHCDLIRMRRTDPVLSGSYSVDGAVLGSSAFLLRYFGPDGDDRLLIVNLGADLDYNPAPEPLLAPPEGMTWRLLLCTESPQYGGSGAPEYEVEGRNWQIPGRAAALFGPVEREENAK